MNNLPSILIESFEGGIQFAISKESGFGLLVELNYLKKEKNYQTLENPIMNLHIS